MFMPAAARKEPARKTVASTRQLRSAVTATSPPRPRALRIIIGYKLVKAPVALLLAGYLAFEPSFALHETLRLSHDLSEGGALLKQLAALIDRAATPHALSRAALLATLDGLTTALEAFLLWRGKPWGEWIVVLGLAALVPLEALAVVRRPSVLRVVVLTLNLAIAAYLARRRVLASRA
jgi:uncharacterized membrane protein (DUF2068 family)